MCEKVHRNISCSSERASFPKGAFAQASTHHRSIDGAAIFQKTTPKTDYLELAQSPLLLWSTHTLSNLLVHTLSFDDDHVDGKGG